MDREEFEKLISRRGFKRPRCPSCGSVSWHGMKDVILLPTESEGAAVLQRGVRSISAICDTCGYIVLYEASRFLTE